ncbi:DUF393 domain-containing protein [Xylophilus sp. Kf1]|nr:DUF393 domain-containing protein [Xylophilus sp. Kf1]
MIFVFDAQCLLCSQWVRFLLKHDHKFKIKFASIQGKQGQELLKSVGLSVDGLQTALLVDENRSWQNTGAILRVLAALGWPWKAAWIFWLVPGPIRNHLYQYLARNRYRWFGRSNICMIPDASQKSRFLD